MRAVGRMAVSVAVLLAAVLVPLTIPVGVSYAGQAASPAPASSPAPTCPPSPTVLADGPPASPVAAAEGARAAAPTPSPYRPAPEEAVACVGSQEINGATFAHWAVVAEDSASPAHRHSAAEPTKPVMETALGFLVSADWVIGEAADLGIELSAGAVRHQFDHLRAQQFPKRSAFNRFLSKTGQTVGDLLLRVRLGMLTSRIQERVTGHGDAHQKRRALTRFVKHFERKWKAQTYCETLYKVAHCGHTARSL
ncbi:MAG TPA: hypothetical protein VNV42_09640 [Solirubrobacteraceae bacterium]|jgi:hypothetical protein|nr:hypothetical protein [Solirubrobacteraceae bacterium]